jgi:hypothetical protein
MTKLTSEAVGEILKTVLFKDDEMEDDNPPAGAVIVDGLVNKYAFHPERVVAAKPQIDALLSELPDNFHKSKGGGWTFLNACQDRHGELWGQHQDMERLICLGIAAESAAWVIKDMANILPGGVPYFEVHPALAQDERR